MLVSNFRLMIEQQKRHAKKMEKSLNLRLDRILEAYDDLLEEYGRVDEDDLQDLKISPNIRQNKTNDGSKL